MRDGVFVLETMLWPDEVRTPDFGFLDESVEVRPQELAMAGSLIDTLSGDFDPTQYKDDLPRGAAAGHRGQGRGPGGRPGRRRRSRRPGPSSTSWRRCGPASRRPRRAAAPQPAAQDDAEAGEEPAAEEPAKRTAKKAPAKKAAARKAPAKKAAAQDEDADEDAKPARKTARARKSA